MIGTGYNTRPCVKGLRPYKPVDFTKFRSKDLRSDLGIPPIDTLIWSDRYCKSWTGERRTDYTRDADDGEFGGTENPTST